MERGLGGSLMDVRRGEQFRLGEWLVVPAENRVAGPHGQSCHVSPKAMDVLVCLAGSIDKVVSKDELLTAVWDTRFVSEGVLANAISELRGAFADDARHPRFIQTIPKRGYRLVEPPQAPIPSTPPPKPKPRRYGVWLGVGALLLGAAGLTLWSRTSHAPEPTRLAVLDFDDLTPPPGDPALAHGMSSMLISDMTRLRGLRVISGYGLQRLGAIATNNDYPAIARRLGAKLLLDGTVLRHEGHIKVAIRLIDGESGSDVWGGSFESQVGDALDLQREVARTVVRETRLRISPGERDWLNRNRDVNPGALLAYTKGVFFYDQWDGPLVPRSVGYFQKAIDLDPEFAPPRARLARSLVALAMVEYIPAARAYPRALEQAQTAVHLNDQLAEAHDALAMVRLMFEWHFRAADAESKKALELNPSSVVAYETQSLVDMAEDREDANVKEMQHALSLAPLSYYAHLRMAWSDFMARHYRDEIAVLKAALELYPTKNVTHEFMAEAYAMLGKPDEVLAQCKLSRRGCLWPRVHAGLDDPLKVLLAKHPDTHTFDLKKLRVDRMRLAGALADLGRTDDAFVQLNKAVDEGSPDVAYFAIWPQLDPLRSDPRWKVLMARVARGSPVVLAANAAR